MIEKNIEYKFDDTKGVDRLHKSKKDTIRKKKGKRTNNDIQSITQKTKDLVT